MKKRFFNKVVTAAMTASILAPFAIFPGAKLIVAQDNEAEAASQSVSTDFNVTFGQTPATIAGQTLWSATIVKTNNALPSYKIRLRDDRAAPINMIKIAGVDTAADADGFFTLSEGSTTIEFQLAQELSATLEIYGTDEAGQNYLMQSAQTPVSKVATTESTTASPTVGSVAAESTTETSSSTTQSATQASAPAAPQKQKMVRSALALPTTGSKDIPKGAIVLEGVFGGLNSAGSAGGSGITVTSDASQNNGVPFSVINLKGQHNWVSIWSNQRYMMDFNKDFKGRTYINFGTAKADGLAFVMQNQSATALTTSVTPDDGQNLGVYGSAKSTGVFGEGGVNLSAIKNSVAIEFDLNSNTDDRGFDKDFPEVPHMAYTFPGDRSKGYKPNSVSTAWGTDTIAKVIHNQLQLPNKLLGTSIQDGTWYEFDYSFSKATGNFSYYLKNPLVGGSQTPTVNIPFTDLSSSLELAKNNNKAYWGFTASNGQNAGDVRFVFTQVPVDFSANVSQDILQNGKTVVDATNSDTFPNGAVTANDTDSITFSAKLNVLSTESPLQVNNWVTYVSPTTIDVNKPIEKATITVGGVTKNLTATFTNKTTGEVTLTAPAGVIVPIGGNAVITFDAKPLAQPSVTPIKSTLLAGRISTNEMVNGAAGVSTTFMTKPLQFWMKKNNSAPTVTNLLTDKSIYTNKKDVFKYTFNYKDVDSDNLTYNVWINGKNVVLNGALTAKPTDQTFTSPGTTAIDVADSTSGLQIGTNTIKVTVKDTVNAVVTSEEKAFTIKDNVAPTLTELKTNDTATFNDFIDKFMYSFKYADADNDALTLNVTINDKPFLTSQSLAGTAAAQTFSKTDTDVIDVLKTGALLHTGGNKINVSISDGINKAVTAEVAFSINGYIGFEKLTDNFSWKYAKTALKPTDTAMPRDDPMTIKIRDTRVAKSNFKVSLTGTSADNALTTDRFTFDTQNLASLNFTANQELNYAKDKGLLLKLKNSDPTKVATGKVTWTMTDAL